MKRDLLKELREGAQLSRGDQIRLIVQLSLPAIMAQLSHIIMQYIDAAMVGRLGSAQSASIGLMASSTWLLSGICQAAVIGFTVQIAQHIGAGEERKARDIMKQAFLLATGFAMLVAMAGAAISPVLPRWLGGSEGICADAAAYFMVFALSLPFVQLNNLAGGALQASGNMRVPSVLQALMCLFDVVFTALGTALSQVVTALLMMFFLLVRSPMMRLRRGEGFSFERRYLMRGLRIAIPIGVERVIMAGAQVMATRIVAPLGTVAIAANSFGVTAESLCYMPGYGISAAASTLIGQSIGAKRDDLTRRLGMLTVGLGIVVMSVSGALMYAFAPLMISIMSPDPAVVSLGAQVLRIEAFAEPMFAASIVCSGVFRGAGDTLVPSIFNFASMWCVRLPLAALLAPHIGLHGVWIGMAADIIIGGILFLIRLRGDRWMCAEKRR